MIASATPAKPAKPAPGTFARGVHPPDHKHLAEDSPVQVLPTPKEVRIPLLQHLGAPGEAAIKPRKPVALGDVIAHAKGFISAATHASVSGKTGRDGKATLPNGRRVPVIPIVADKEQALEGQALYDAMLGGEWPTSGLDQIDPKSIADAALKGGLVGLGGAAFPSHVKLMRNEKKPADTLLLNGCECEPFLTADYRLMVEAPRAVIAGARLAAHATGVKRIIIALEDDTPKAAQILRDAAEGTGIEVREFPTKYPQGGEKQLVRAATGRVVPNGGLPLDVGIVVMNVGTVSALARMILRELPLTHRIISVTGGGIVRPSNFLVPIGTPFGNLIEAAGGFTGDAARMIAGGPMMGFAFSDLDSPVTKGSSGLTILTKQDVAKAEETACVRCGRCVDVCPVNLVPTKLALASRSGAWSLASQYHIFTCIECGCCTYQCPASIPIVQLIRTGKTAIKRG